MSFDFTTLITDRTQADVDRVKAIAKKIENGTASESELAEFNSAAMKGAYNYTDLNRVTAAMEALKANLEGYGYAVPWYHQIRIDHPKGKLPAGYTNVAYIEGTGTQHIDTGYKPNNKTKVVLDIELSTNTSVGEAVTFFAARDLTNTVYFCLAKASTSSYNIHWQYGSEATITFQVASAEALATRRVVEVDGAKATIDGSSQSYTETTFTVPYTLCLLANNNNGTVGYHASGKIYSCQIYDNGVLVRDYVPCINPSSEVGLYDLVTEEFFGNSGTGVFIAGDTIRVYEEFDPYLWYEVDWPTEGTMAVYLGNVAAIRSVLAVLTTTPVVPADMVGLMAKEANNIETILMDVFRQLAILPTTFIPSGEALSGGDNL